jgi:phospho-N-acetylmuramoyl-pentapeptide-transferase
VLGPFITFLKEQLVGQYIREDGPEQHHTKKGTPTMGGIAIIGGILLSSLFILFFLGGFNLETLLIYLIIIAFGLLGFSDDYLKVIKKHNKGLTGWTKLLVQLILAALVGFFVFYFQDRSTVSFFGLADINLGYVYILFAIVVIIGSSNAINLTDGLDGLAALTCAVSFLTLCFMFLYTGQLQLAIITAAVAGSCLAFLAYNINPAKIFMGDVGSLMLGGLFGTLGVLGGLEFWLIPVGIIFVVEALSVIIQVISFKSTGKRIFKMTPLHHHFELLGDKEPAVVLKFYSVQVLVCVLTIFFWFYLVH